ncbi:MAG: MerR family transcriptional regulator [Anaerolineae bacterium]|nr:MAG: MerR family transcriptional regulator [Anaerolineae bacterium]
MVTKTEYTIQQVAEITGLSGHTLRYYERIGLLSSVDRAANGHRRYTDDTIREIEFLNKLRATGMPIREMQHYAKLRRQGQSTLAERQAMLKSHHVVVTEQLRLLQEYLKVIEYKIALYQQLQEEQQHESTSVGS